MKINFNFGDIVIVDGIMKKLEIKQIWIDVEGQKRYGLFLGKQKICSPTAQWMHKHCKLASHHPHTNIFK